MADLEVADILARFPAASRLSAGAQKQVWALDHDDHGHCVLKIGAYSSPQSLERIQREVRILLDLRSTYFPTCHHFEILDRNRFLILEEHVVGTVLEKALDRFTDLHAAALYISEAVVGLSELWRRRVIHRDLKPANLFATPDGHPKIIDLGIARILDDESLTLTLAPFGPCTPAYAAPEQLLNQKRLINHRTDQFALGIVFAQLLLGGRHPFDPRLVGGAHIPENILSGRWAHSSIPATCRSALPVLSRMLSPHPFQRFRTPDLLHDALVALHGGRP